MEIGHRIKKERMAAGLTQVGLAQRIGVDKSAVGQWESPNSNKGISLASLLKVADPLGISVNRLTGDAEDSEQLQITDQAEIKLVRLFRQMTAIQKDAHLQLFHVSVGLTQPE